MTVEVGPTVGVVSSEGGCVVGADGVPLEQAASTRANNPRTLGIRGSIVLLPTVLHIIMRLTLTRGRDFSDNPVRARTIIRNWLL